MSILHLRFLCELKLILRSDREAIGDGLAHRPFGAVKRSCEQAVAAGDVVVEHHFEFAVSTQCLRQQHECSVVGVELSAFGCGAACSHVGRNGVAGRCVVECPCGSQHVVRSRVAHVGNGYALYRAGRHRCAGLHDNGCAEMLELQRYRSAYSARRTCVVAGGSRYEVALL